MRNFSLFSTFVEVDYGNLEIIQKNLIVYIHHFLTRDQQLDSSNNERRILCILCMRSGESIDHLFLDCLLTLGLWHQLFSLVKMDWIPLRSICDMMTITFRGLWNSIKGKSLWPLVCLTILQIVWLERNVRIFEEKWRKKEMWDLLHFYSFLQASCIIAFRNIPLNVI